MKRPNTPGPFTQEKTKIGWLSGLRAGLLHSMSWVRVPAGHTNMEQTASLLGTHALG